jgi:hypothetical protein
MVNWKQVINDLSSNIHTKIDSLYTNLTDIVKQESNATYSKIHTKIDNLYANLTKLMNQTIDDTYNKINIKPDNVSTKPTQIMTESQYTVMFTLFLPLDVGQQLYYLIQAYVYE